MQQPEGVSGEPPSQKQIETPDLAAMKKRHYGTSLWESVYDDDIDEEGNNSSRQQAEAAAQDEEEEDDGDELVSVTVGKASKLYIRVRDDPVDHSVYITHFDRKEDGQPGPVEAPGTVAVGDYLVGVDKMDVQGREVKQILGLIRGSPHPKVILTFMRKASHRKAPLLGGAGVGEGEAAIRRGSNPQAVQLTEQHRVVILKHLIASEQIAEERLRFLASRGIPDIEKNLRPLIWRILLAYLPFDRTVWPEQLAAQRAVYAQLLKDLTVTPTHDEEKEWPPSEEASVQQPKQRDSSTSTTTTRDAEVWQQPFPLPPATPSQQEEEGKGDSFAPAPLPASAQAQAEEDLVKFKKPLRTKVSDDPLNQAESSTWARFFNDQVLFDEIRKDVIRTHPDQNFFLDTTHGPARYDAMQRILFIYAKMNPGIRYVQGMNEVLGTIYFVLAADPDKEWADHAEADSFFCFTHLMSQLKDLFIQNLDDTDSGIEGKINQLVQLLWRHDPELSDCFAAQSLDTRYYSLRWITTLLSREFNLADTIRIWDSLFADRKLSDFVLYFCLAMLLDQRTELMAGDFANNLRLLQNYPPADVQGLLDRMYALREYDARLAKENHAQQSPTRLQRFLRSVATQLEELHMPAALDSMSIDPENLRLPRMPTISAEQQQKLKAAGTQIKTSLSTAAGNVRKMWGNLQLPQQAGGGHVLGGSGRDRGESRLLDASLPLSAAMMDGVTSAGPALSPAVINDHGVISPEDRKDGGGGIGQSRLDGSGEGEEEEMIDYTTSST